MLNKTQLVNDLRTIYDSTINSTDDAETSKELFIQRQADAIERYVKSAQINYAGGLSAGSNVVVGTFNGSLS